jgi:hypothetical protein
VKPPQWIAWSKTVRWGALLPACCAILSLALIARAEAHSTSTTYLTAIAGDDAHEVRATWDIPVADFHWILDLDADGNGRITWSEIDSRREDVFTLARAHLAVDRGASACDILPRDVLLTQHAGEPHLSLDFQARCATEGPLTLSAGLFFDTNPTQRTLIDVTTPSGAFTSILSPGEPRWHEPAAPSSVATFQTFVGQGIWHVWIGYDHLAFLVLLLLPGVLKSTREGWRGAGAFRESAGDLVRIITAFTLAHSMTLALSATGTVEIPVRPIEIAIAASIVVAGVLNLFAGAARTRLALAFGFGLVHGFGFANALSEIGTSSARLIPTLAGFNAGVELAQLAVAAAVLPLLYRARHSSFYAGRFMPLASLCAAMAGAAWLVARTG